MSAGLLFELPVPGNLWGHLYGFGLLQLTLNNSVFSIAVENDTAGETYSEHSQSHTFMKYVNMIS